MKNNICCINIDNAYGFDRYVYIFVKDLNCVIKQIQFATVNDTNKEWKP